MSSLPSVGKEGSADIEQILSLNPDVVLLKYWQVEDIVEKLEGVVPVVTFRMADPATYSENVEKIGRIFSRENKASEFIAWYEDKLEVIRVTLDGVEGEEKPDLFQFYGGEYGMVEGPPYGTFGSEKPL